VTRRRRARERRAYNRFRRLPPPVPLARVCPPGSGRLRRMPRWAQYLSSVTAPPRIPHALTWAHPKHTREQRRRRLRERRHLRRRWKAATPEQRERMRLRSMVWVGAVSFVGVTALAPRT
jgi:hypothetical protein